MKPIEFKQLLYLSTMSKSKTTKSKLPVTKDELITFKYLLILNNNPDDSRYQITKTKDYVLEKMDNFEYNFYKNYPLDEEEDDKVWVGSKLYLADETKSNFQLAKYCNIEELVAVDKSTTLGDVKKMNNRVYGKHTTPLLILKASTVPRKLLEERK